MQQMGMAENIFRGSTDYLASPQTPQISPAALDLAERAKNYSPENPLYVVAIGCLTNIASALLIAPEIEENIVLVVMGGNSDIWDTKEEFNLSQDFTASKIVFNCKAPLIQLPGMNVASEFRITKPEIEFWLSGKSAIADYLADYTVSQAENYAKGRPWSRVLWDVPAVAWLINDNDKFMKIRVINLPSYLSDDAEKERLIGYIYWVNRDNIFEDIIKKISDK